MAYFLRNICLCILVIPMLSGCLAAGVAAATGIGGYMSGRYVTKRDGTLSDREVDARDTYLMQQSKISTDERLASSINKQLLRGLNSDLSLETSVKDGVATLFGTTPNPDVADKVIDVVRRVKGVQKVVPKLNVVSLQRAGGNAGFHQSGRQLAPQAASQMATPYGAPRVAPRTQPAYPNASAYPSPGSGGPYPVPHKAY